MHATQSWQSAQPMHHAQRRHRKQPTRPMLPATSALAKVAMLPATTALPKVPIEPATAALPTVPIEPATAALPSVPMLPAMAALAMVLRSAMQSELPRLLGPSVIDLDEGPVLCR